MLQLFNWTVSLAHFHLFNEWQIFMNQNSCVNLEFLLNVFNLNVIFFVTGGILRAKILNFQLF